MTESRTVAITGMGVVSAAGRGANALAAALQAHRICSSPVDMALPIRGAAQVPVDIDLDPDFADDRKAHLAFAALQEAQEQAGVELSGPRTGVFLGTGLSSITPRELAEDVYPHLRDGRFDRDAMAADLSGHRVAPRRHMPARVTEAIAQRIGAEGRTATSFSACAAAAQAMAAGMWAIRRGQLDRVVVGGHDSMIHPMGILSFVVLGALSPDACRPFDRGRDGFMIGEGAAVFVLESEQTARARGAQILARVAGAGTSVDAWNVTAPHPRGEGAERAMRCALQDAKKSIADVDYINAHGTGTPVGDVAEAAAIHRIFGGHVPVSSIKGAIGHTIAAAGALEAAATVLALQGGWLPGTVGHRDTDSACPISVINEPRPSTSRVAISNSFGFGGQNCALVLEKGED